MIANHHNLPPTGDSASQVRDVLVLHPIQNHQVGEPSGWQHMRYQRRRRSYHWSQQKHQLAENGQNVAGTHGVICHQSLI
jgi:hypothetical protein